MKTTWNKQKKENRLSKDELNQYRHWLSMTYSVCQICGGFDLDIPHHVGIGIKRDDRFQISICIGCHRKIHNSSFKWHIKIPKQDKLNEIAKNNWLVYNE